MSHRTQQFRKVAASGPRIEVKDSRGATVFHRVWKTRDEFADTLPTNMNPEKRARVIARLYGN